MKRLSGLFHKKIYLLWNRPESLFLRMVQDVSYTQPAIYPTGRILKVKAL
jgi:hypothetical protein